MRFGVRIPVDGTVATPENITILARAAECTGFDVLEIPDHIVVPMKIHSRYPYSVMGEAKFAGGGLEQLTTLAFLAAKTSRIKIMTSIMVAPHRNPLLAAKMLATLDVLSGGRLVVGVGAGWMREEFEALGLPDFDERGYVTNEYIRIFKEVWAKDDEVAFQGKYSSFSGIKVLPKPVQKPHPPIWVGGESPAALKRAAKYGDFWYPFDSNPRFPLRNEIQLKAAIESLAAYARGNNRRPEEIGFGYGVRNYKLVDDSAQDSFFVGNAEKIRSDALICEDLGIGYLAFNLAGQTLRETIENIEKFANEIITPLVARSGNGRPGSRGKPASPSR